MINPQSPSPADLVARAQARIARLNQATEALTTELGLPPEAKYEVLATVFRDGFSSVASQTATEVRQEPEATQPVLGPVVADALAAARRSVGLVLTRTRQDLAAGAQYWRHGARLGPAWETTGGFLGPGGTSPATAEPVKTNTVLLPPTTSGEPTLIEVRATRPDQDTLVLDVHQRTQAPLTLWLFKGVSREGQHHWELVETHSITASAPTRVDAPPAYQRIITRAEFPEGERLEVAVDADLQREG